MNKGDVVAVYGSARIAADHPVYADSLRLGSLLGAAGYTVMSGGYGGVMEAVSKGAHDAGGRTIGVTVKLFEDTGRRSGHNAYLDEVIMFDLLTEREVYLVRNCQAAIACGGGIGTLSEITLLWTLIQTGEMPVIPLILIGDMWPRIVDILSESGEYVSERTQGLVRYAADADEAMRLLDTWE